MSLGSRVFEGSDEINKGEYTKLDFFALFGS